MHANDLFATITAQLIDDIETGAAGTWRMPWHHLADAGTPTSIDHRPYRGMNAVWLAMVAAAHDWTSGTFGTYRAWQRHGAQVRRGERATQVVLWKPTYPTDAHTKADDTDGTTAGRPRLIARAYAVFAAEQCDGADDIIARRNQQRTERDTPARIDAAEQYLTAVAATVIEGGNRAYYRPATDSIHLPTLAQFDTAAHYYATRAHDPLTAPTERFDHHLGPARRCDQVALERRRMWLDRRRRGHPGRWGIWSSRVSVVSNVATINPVFGCSMQPGCR